MRNELSDKEKQQVCSNCNYWKETLYDYGICSKIGEKLEIDLILGWDGGHVNFIETESDFGCNQFEEK